MPEYIRHGEGTFSSLTKQQKEAVGLLSIGTFLEYFDLMLYVHMAVLLNELFFPKADAHTQAIYSALAFCSTYVLRAFGALIFGYIGDNIGRKTTVIITTFMMAASCIIMANLPTYAQIGITATYIVSACRIIQGLSSCGEIVGAQIYLTEITKPPIQYPIVAQISIFSSLGGMIALGFASLVTSFGFNWRIAFWFGAGIAIIGTVVRSNLRETVVFANAKLRLKEALEKVNIAKELLKEPQVIQQNICWKTLFFLFLIHCGWPTCFYFTYIYCGNILKNSFNYSAEQIIHHNFIISIVNFLAYIIFSYLSYIIYPLKILKIRLIILFIFIIICPVLLNNVTIPLHLLLIQSFIMIFFLSGSPAMPIFYKNLPVFKRFTAASFIFAFSYILIFFATSFGLIFLTKYFGYFGVQLILLPITIGFAFGLFYFEKIEQGKTKILP